MDIRVDCLCRPALRDSRALSLGEISMCALIRETRDYDARRELTNTSVVIISQVEGLCGTYACSEGNILKGD